MVQTLEIKESCAPSIAAHEWECPDCKGVMIVSNEYVGGRGFVPHCQCTNIHCLFSASEAYMINRFGADGKGRN